MTLTVLQLVANRWWTGSADPVIQLVRGLRARGHRVMLGLIAGDRFEVKAREAGITPLAGLSLEVGFHPLATAGDVLRLRRLIRRDGVDIVHVHHSHDHWLGEISRGSAALVRTFHNQGAVRGAWPDTALYRRADALVALSGPTEERCRHVGVGPDRLFRLEGVAAVERFSGAVDAEATRRELGLGRGPVVGSVARLADSRGHEALIRGFQRLLSDFPDARLVLVGKGEARPRLERLVSDLGVERAVVFAGYRDADLPAVVGTFDVFVLMRAGSDETCRAALEAMAAGRPVVARRVGALPDAVEHGRTGLLLDDDAPPSVEAGLRALLTDPGRATDMGAAGRKRALEAFTPERHAARMEEVYLAALAQRRRRRAKGPWSGL
jgi:glycosyltransferase involved in cell wall biosynthesis